MNLAQMLAVIDEDTAYSFSIDRRLAAVNDASRWLYDWILKENRGYWIKWDTSSLVLTPGVEEYALPPDLENIVRLRERATPLSSWCPMEPSDSLVDPALLLPAGTAGLPAYGGPTSTFHYFGPYLDAAGASGEPQGPKKLRIGPIPADVRQTELAYSVRFTEVTTPTSYLFIPDEGSGRTALMDLATALLLDNQDDSVADRKRSTGMSKLQLFLATIRGQQEQEASTCTPYIDDLD